jgi:hypothetical protein
MDTQIFQDAKTLNRILTPPLDWAAERAGLGPGRNRGFPSVRPAPRVACGGKLVGPRDTGIIRKALQRRG